MCDTCVGDDHFGATEIRLKKYQQFAKKRKYGLTPKSFDDMLHAQSGKCGLCESHMKQPCIDHDHKTERVRGLLCHRCNLLLGQVEIIDPKRWLENASLWIERGRKT